MTTDHPLLEKFESLLTELHHHFKQFNDQHLPLESKLSLIQKIQIITHEYHVFIQNSFSGMNILDIIQLFPTEKKVGLLSLWSEVKQSV